MTDVNASTSTQSVVFTTTSSQLAFSFQDPGGVNSEFDYSFFTLGGDDMQLTGAGIDFGNSPPTTGTVTDIEIDLGNNSFVNPDVLITAITAPGGDAEVTALVAGAASFFAELMSDDDLMTGSAFTDTFEAGAGNDFLTMGASNDVAFGGDGNDTLNGGTGADTLDGGANDDSYIIDNVGDVTIEAAGGGDDAVQSSVTYTLGANVETLALSGAAAINGTGNALANLIVGNAANNTLNGGLGADTLQGLAGNDTYVVDNIGEVVVEAAGGGVDVVQSGVSHALAANVENLTLVGFANLAGTGNGGGNVITGNAGDNLLFGRAGNDVINAGTGNDVLDGGSGVDNMAGGTGNDSYTVDNAGDVTVEAANAGVDGVKSSVAYGLAPNLENLTLTGIANINGAGNGLANLVVGNDGNNFLFGVVGDDTLTGGLGNDNLIGGADDDVLDGGIGADVMTGGTGDDSYTIDAAADVAVEAAGGGVDSVNSSITDALDPFVENMTLTGVANIDATGNAGANLLVGNVGANLLLGGTGADTLAGGAASDTLTGGAGLDVYDFDALTDSGPGAATRDVITFFENTGAAAGDLMDLSGIDADTSTAADDAFNFLGVRQNPFPPATAAGDLWVRNEGGATVVYGNVDNDNAPELAIVITDGGVQPNAYDPADFVL